MAEILRHSWPIRDKVAQRAANGSFSTVQVSEVPSYEGIWVPRCFRKKYSTPQKRNERMSAYARNQQTWNASSTINFDQCLANPIKQEQNVNLEKTEVEQQQLRIVVLRCSIKLSWRIARNEHHQCRSQQSRKTKGVRRILLYIFLKESARSQHASKMNGRYSGFMQC